VPLQLGVRDVAFPTLNSVGFRRGIARPSAQEPVLPRRIGPPARARRNMALPQTSSAITVTMPSGDICVSPQER
jgi:hypothetical protein